MTARLLPLLLLFALPAALAQTAPTSKVSVSEVVSSSDAIGSSDEAGSSDEIGCADDGSSLTPFTGVASTDGAGTACIDERTGMVGDVMPPTAAEEQVRAQILEDGVHVVHFWAPWCGNSLAELEAGWYEVIERHPDVTFTFVTIWNDGETGQETLDRYAIPARVEVLTQPDFGASSDKSQRRRTFLGLPVTWIPSTWVFHDNGELAVAYNYGELDMAQIDGALELVTADWSH
ncbi:MAG: thioredoxin family protein [Bacteroidota bacterium]